MNSSRFNGDLVFMDIVRKANTMLLPFNYIVTGIENTHRQGLDVQE